MKFIKVTKNENTFHKKGGEKKKKKKKKHFSNHRPEIYKKAIKHIVRVRLFVLSNEFVQESEHGKKRLHCRSELSSKMSPVYWKIVRD